MELSEAVIVAIDIIAGVAIVDLRKTSDLIHVAQETGDIDVQVSPHGAAYEGHCSGCS